MARKILGAAMTLLVVAAVAAIIAMPALAPQTLDSSSAVKCPAPPKDVARFQQRYEHPATAGLGG